MTQDQKPTVTVEVRAGVGVVILSRPARLNAINHAMLVDLRAALIALGERADVGAVVLAGEGRSFCAGLDLEEGLADPSIADPATAMQAGMQVGAGVTLALRSIPQPVIAAIRGHAVGAGFAFAAAADVRLLSEDVRFSAPFHRLGMTAGDFGLSWLLPRLIGWGRASAVVYSGSTVGAGEAVAIGLAARVCADPLADALELASEIAEQPLYGVRGSKRLLESGGSSSLVDHLQAEARAQTIGALTSEAQVAMAAALRRGG